jgi:polysaccharide biosynthesis transport protein
MSKHFELMQKMEAEKRSAAHHFADPPSRPAHRDGHTSRPAHRDGRNIHPQWASDEALRLVQQIFMLPTEDSPRLVVFAGMDHGNGCSEICASVAETLAKSARGPVCLVEANFHSPTLLKLFGTTNYHGLTDALVQQDQSMASFAKPLQQENLWLLSSGAIAADSSQLLCSDGLRERLLDLRNDFDYVIIDAPPLTRYPESTALGQIADGLVLVLEAEATRREAASAVAASLRAANVPILAAVLNKRNFPIPEKLYKRL